MHTAIQHDQDCSCPTQTQPTKQQTHKQKKRAACERHTTDSAQRTRRAGLCTREMQRYQQHTGKRCIRNCPTSLLTTALGTAPPNTHKVNAVLTHVHTKADRLAHSVHASRGARALCTERSHSVGQSEFRAHAPHPKLGVMHAAAHMANRQQTHRAQRRACSSAQRAAPAAAAAAVQCLLLLLKPAQQQCRLAGRAPPQGLPVAAHPHCAAANTTHNNCSVSTHPRATQPLGRFLPRHMETPAAAAIPAENAQPDSLPIALQPYGDCPTQQAWQPVSPPAAAAAEAAGPGARPGLIRYRRGYNRQQPRPATARNNTRSL